MVVTSRRVVGLRVVIGVPRSESDVGSLLEPVVVSPDLSSCEVILGGLLVVAEPVADS